MRNHKIFQFILKCDVKKNWFYRWYIAHRPLETIICIKPYCRFCYIEIKSAKFSYRNTYNSSNNISCPMIQTHSKEKLGNNFSWI